MIDCLIAELKRTTNKSPLISNKKSIPLKKNIEQYKKEKRGNSEELKQLWIFETILKAQELYCDFIELLYNNKYYDAWVKLEHCEIQLNNITRHFTYNKDDTYHIYYLVSMVESWQSVFPYTIFCSTEMVHKKTRCSICGEYYTLRTHCGHIKGEVYDGYICHHIIEDIEFVGVAMVENPVNKFSVPFSQDPETGKTIDHYDYSEIEFIKKELLYRFEPWFVDKKTIKRKNIELDIHRFCGCGSRKEFLSCCYLKRYTDFEHHEIIKIPEHCNFESFKTHYSLFSVIYK
ncbi:hypothetical protein [Aeromonas veronii]|uniref:hypothetical protein n=1 Tax=Aeromonas veronii TaxID=654 RepID=UPI002B4A2875|nr:hypothetical protein [Aeromonas veronii]